MKDELGIEIKCENCKFCSKQWCTLLEETTMRVSETVRCVFKPDDIIYKQRIEELQEQVFTREELNTIIDALKTAKEEFAFCPEEKAFDEILKKTKRILNER